MGATFRRARRVVGKEPDPRRVRGMKKALGKARALARRGVCDLVFGDESGFCLVPPLPYAWQLPQRPLCLRAQAHTRRVNVLGFWKEAAQEPASLVHRQVEGAITGAVFVQAVEEQLLPFVRRPTVLVVDNAGLHRCRLVQERRAAWKAQGLRVWFLPPYCPHLNRIEVLWRNCKYHWLEPAAYADFPSLRRHLSYILRNVGTKYQLTFG